MKIMIMSMARCGHHAVIQWIAEGTKETVKIRHNCLNGWDKKELNPNKVTYHEGGRKNHTIATLEDFHLPLWHKLKRFEKFDKVITVVRSPRNWLASSIASPGWANDYLEEPPEYTKELPVSRIDAFKVYLMHYIGEYDADNVFPVDYDRWILNEKYRNKVANELEIECVDLPKHCKFSSFRIQGDYTKDRSKLLKGKRKERFDLLYDGYLIMMQGEHWSK
jgi:hypothetical protein